MKRLAVALVFLGLASATNVAEMDIWEEETEELINACANPNKRWAHPTNSAAIYKKMLTQKT